MNAIGAKSCEASNSENCICIRCVVGEYTFEFFRKILNIKQNRMADPISVAVKHTEAATVYVSK